MEGFKKKTSLPDIREPQGRHRQRSYGTCLKKHQWTCFLCLGVGLYLLLINICLFGKSKNEKNGFGNFG